MASLNKVMLLGNLGDAPEMRFTPDGQPLARMRIATHYLMGGGQEITDWHTVTTFGVEAENCNKYLSKGDMIFVEGRLQTRQYEKEGEKRERTEVIAQRIQFLKLQKGVGESDS